MSRADFRFAYRFRVRWSEVDPQGVVFNARYLDYADLAVTEYFRAAGIPQGSAADEFQIHVARAEVDFRAPVRADELIDALARIERYGNTSMTILIELHGAGAEDLRAAIKLVQVHVDLADHRPRPIPEAIKAHFTALDGRDAPLLRGELG